MRRLFYAMVLLLVSVGFLVAQNSAQPSGKKYVIGFSNFSVGNSWRIQMEAEFVNRAEELKSQGVISNYLMTNSNGDISKQIADVKDLITKKVNAILITASSPTALVPVCEEAMAKGIVVINFDQLMNSKKLTSLVAIDDKEFGRVGGKFLAEALHGKGNIIVLNGVAGTQGSANRHDGAMMEIKKAPGIKVLTEANGDWDYAKGKTAVENLLSAYPQIDGVYSQGGAMTQGAIDAFVAAGRKLVPMVGEANNGYLKEWKKYIPEGYVGLAPSCPTYMSASALDTAIDALNGKKVEKVINLPVPTITQNDIDKYLKPDLPDSLWNITKLPDDQIKKLFSR